MGRKRSRSYSDESSSSDQESDTSSHRKRGRHTKRDRQRQRRDEAGSDEEGSSNRRRKSRHTRPDKDAQIDVDDSFYTHSRHFRYWLKHDRSKPKDFAKLDAKEQRRLFKKFVRRWNKGRLDRGYYDGSVIGEGPSQISDGSAAAGATTSTASASTTLAPAAGMHPDRLAKLGAGPSRGSFGPTRPTYDDLTMQRESEMDRRAAERDAAKAERKRSAREAREEERDNRATGKDRLMEKRQEVRQTMRELTAAKEQGDMEFGEDFLIGPSSNSSFAEAIRRRDMGRQNQERQRRQQFKQAELEEKRSVHKIKEDNTIAMFKAMAAARYGPPTT